MVRSEIFKLRVQDCSRLEAALESCRQLYNRMLWESIWAFDATGKPLTFFDMNKRFTELRAGSQYLPFAVDMVRWTVFRRISYAFQEFFRRVKKGEKAGLPRYRGPGRFSSLRFTCRGWKLQGQYLHLRGIGKFAVVGQRRLAGEVKGLYVVRRADRWEAQVAVDIGDAPAVQASGDGVGVDFGIRNFATLSDGTQVKHPHFLRKDLTRLQKKGRALSKKRRGSKRYEKAQMELARLHVKAANRRRNFLHQKSRELVNTYDGFAIEKLDIAGMVQTEPKEVQGKRRRAMRRNIMDSAWSTFIFYLGYKAESAGKPVVMVDPKGTSQRCSVCGTVVKKTLKDRLHDCPACGFVADRDLNAAQNIHDLGWRSAPNLLSPPERATGTKERGGSL